MTENDIMVTNSPSSSVAMPKPFTTSEREAVKRRLREVASQSLAARGLRGTSVASLASAAGISKGAFYLFYPSKEALVFDVLADAEAAVRAELERRLAEGPASERLRRFFRFTFEVVERHPVLRLLSDPEEAPALFRALPPAELAARIADDDRWFGALFKRFRDDGLLGDVDPEVLAAWPRMALGIAQQRALVGEHYGALADLLSDALARRLVE